MKIIENDDLCSNTFLFLTRLDQFLKMLRVPCVFGPNSTTTTTNQNPCVVGHPTLEKYDSATFFERQNTKMQ